MNGAFQCMRICDLCEVTSSKRIFASEYKDEGVPFYRGKEIGEKHHGKLNVSTELFISQEKFNEIKSKFDVPKGGDLLLTSIGALLGSPYVVKRGEEFYFKDGNVTWFKNFNGLYSHFLYYWLLSPQGKGELDKSKIGSAQPAFTIQLLKQMEIYIPSLPNQHRIASILSAYDDLIENNTQRIAILEEMARRIYQEWFVNFCFPGHEKVRMVDSELGKIPEGWEVKPVSEIVHINPKTRMPKEGEKPFLPMSGLSETSMLISDVTQKEGNSGAKFQNGDTLFARITPCLENGKTGFVEFLSNNSDVAFGSTEFIVLRSRLVCPEYVYLMARSESFREHAIKSMSGATGRQRVRVDCFNNLFVAKPDNHSIQRFGETVRPMFKLVGALARKSANLRTQRDLLLPKLISGEIDVSNMDIPNLKDQAA